MFIKLRRSWDDPKTGVFQGAGVVYCYLKFKHDSFLTDFLYNLAKMRGSLHDPLAGRKNGCCEFGIKLASNASWASLGQRCAKRGFPLTRKSAFCCLLGNSPNPLNAPSAQLRDFCEIADLANVWSSSFENIRNCVPQLGSWTGMSENFADSSAAWEMFLEKGIDTALLSAERIRVNPLFGGCVYGRFLEIDSRQYKSLSKAFSELCCDRSFRLAIQSESSAFRIIRLNLFMDLLKSLIQRGGNLRAG